MDVWSAKGTSGAHRAPHWSGHDGVGLSTAYGIIKQSGGEIRVDAPPLPIRPSVHEVLTPSGNETVLIVDDEIHVGRKPFSSSQLAPKVREVLDRPESPSA